MTKEFKFIEEGYTWKVYINMENALNDIEEQIYILWELTPMGRNWRYEAMTDNRFMADYCGMYRCSIVIDWDEYTVRCSNEILTDD